SCSLLFALLLAFIGLDLSAVVYWHSHCILHRSRGSSAREVPHNSFYVPLHRVSQQYPAYSSCVSRRLRHFRSLHSSNRPVGTGDSLGSRWFHSGDSAQPCRTASVP